MIVYLRDNTSQAPAEAIGLVVWICARMRDLMLRIGALLGIQITPGLEDWQLSPVHSFDSSIIWRTPCVKNHPECRNRMSKTMKKLRIRTESDVMIGDDGCMICWVCRRDQPSRVAKRTLIALPTAGRLITQIAA